MKTIVLELVPEMYLGPTASRSVTLVVTVRCCSNALDMLRGVDPFFLWCGQPSCSLSIFVERKVIQGSLSEVCRLFTRE